MALIFDAFSRNAQTAYFATSIERQLGFHHSRRRILGCKNPSADQVFRNAPQELIFLNLCRFYEKNQGFWIPFGTQWAPKWYQKPSKCRQAAPEGVPLPGPRGSASVFRSSGAFRSAPPVLIGLFFCCGSFFWCCFRPLGPFFRVDFAHLSLIIRVVLRAFL